MDRDPVRLPPTSPVDNEAVVLVYEGVAMSKQRAVVRQWTLLRVLAQQKAGLSISEMARYMAVNERTIRRDISLFVQAGVPLREAVGRRGKKAWRVDDRASLRTDGHSLEEALVLLLVEQIFAPLRGCGLLAAAQRCRQKIAASLSHPEQAKFDRYAKVLSLRCSQGELAVANLSAIRAVWEGIESLQ